MLSKYDINVQQMLSLMASNCLKNPGNTNIYGQSGLYLLENKYTKMFTGA